MRNSYYVYLMTNKSGTLYIGVTNNLERRVWEHKSCALSGFTKKYAMDRLVYFEDYPYVVDAIGREKQIKGWLRRRKFELIRSMNPKWLDLATDWYEENLPQRDVVSEEPDSSLRSE